MRQSYLCTSRRDRRILGGVIALATAACIAATAFATANDRTAAEQAIAAIERNPADAALAGDSLKQAKQALRRAREMHGVSDHAHAALLERVAREWADAATDVLRAAAAEKRASGMEVEANDVEQKALRAQALIEETLARRNRAKERLEEMKTDSKPPSPSSKSAAPSKSAPAPASAKGTAKPVPTKPAPKLAPGEQP